MKFYYFGEDKFDYLAVIWAKDTEEARITYSKEVCDEPYGCNYPHVIDVDEVLQMMLDSERDDDREVRAHGEIGELYKIITSKEPVMVLHNCM